MKMPAPKTPEQPKVQEEPVKPHPISWDFGVKGSACQNPNCKSERLVHVLSHALDRHVVWIGKLEYCNDLPFDLGIGGGSDNEYTLCLNCGQMQGQWPLPEAGLEKEAKELANRPKEVGLTIPGVGPVRIPMEQGPKHESGVRSK